MIISRWTQLQPFGGGGGCGVLLSKSGVHTSLPGVYITYIFTVPFYNLIVYVLRTTIVP